MSNSTVDASKRTWLIASSCAGAVALVVAVPFVASFQPRTCQGSRCSGRSRHLGPAAGTEDDGGMARQAGLDHAPHAGAGRGAKLDSEMADPKSERNAYPTPEYAKNTGRSIKPEIFVAVGICTHLGCSPTDKLAAGPQPSPPDDWQGGFLCPCHGSTFDLAAASTRTSRRPDNLEVPPHMYLSDTRVLIGEDKLAAAAGNSRKSPERQRRRQVEQLAAEPLPDRVRRYKVHMSEYYAPKNFNFWYFFVCWRCWCW